MKNNELCGPPVIANISHYLCVLIFLVFYMYVLFRVNPTKCIYFIFMKRYIHVHKIVLGSNGDSCNWGSIAAKCCLFLSPVEPLSVTVLHMGFQMQLVLIYNFFCNSKAVRVTVLLCVSWPQAPLRRWGSAWGADRREGAAHLLGALRSCFSSPGSPGLCTWALLMLSLFGMCSGMWAKCFCF